MLRGAGIVALVVLAACNESSPKPSPSLSPIVAQGSWTQNLTFAGELSGHMAGIVPDVGVQKSQCTGGRTHNGETWADIFYGTVDGSGDGWGAGLQSHHFPGPGPYKSSTVNAKVPIA